MPADDSDDDEENDGYEHYKEWHGDHWDEVDYLSRWKNWDIGDEWPHNFMRDDEKSIPNDQLLENPVHRHWLRKLSGLHRKDLPSLNVRVAGIPKIPLFEDAKTGDHYSLHIRPGSQIGLDHIYCRDNLAPTPEDPTPWSRLADPLYKVRYRKPFSGDLAHNKQPAPPNYIIVLGNLAVRTSFRPSWDSFLPPRERPPTEDTDYLVAVDAGHEDLPVWLVISRSSLRDRAEFDGTKHPQLPVFKALLRDDIYGYDTACIYRSIRDIAGPTDFDEVCELVRETRAVADPGILNLEENKMAELSGTVLPEDWHNSNPVEEVTPPPPEKVVDDHVSISPADSRRATSF